MFELMEPLTAALQESLSSIGHWALAPSIWLEQTLPDAANWLRSTAEEWPALAMTVATAVASKATGGFYRMNEAWKEAPADADFVMRRELDNLWLVAGITLLTQILAFKPMVAVLKKLARISGKLDKNMEAVVRMVLFAPGLFASEWLSRVLAGQSIHDRLLRERRQFNERINRNWQRLVNPPLSIDGPAAPLRTLAISDAHVTTLPVKPLPMVITSSKTTVKPSVPTPVVSLSAMPVYPSGSLMAGLAAVPSPGLLQAQLNAMATVPKTF